MFKKIFCIIAIAILAITVTSCKKKEKPSETPKVDPSTYEYKTPETDALKLTQDYEGKNFMEDGIGEVTVTQYVDGDTTIFRNKDGRTFTSRYLGIDTPESTYKVEPWGFEASNHTKRALQKAKKIVCTCDDINERCDNNGRWLTWVWLIDENGDSRLLNLELVEVALAKSKANDTSLSETFIRALKDVSKVRCRIYGEEDPSYDYRSEVDFISLKEIKEKYGTVEALKEQRGKGTKVKVAGVVARLNGITSAYIQQFDDESNEYYGIYVYGGYSAHTEFEIGNSVTFDATIGFYGGSLQLTSLSNLKVKQFADYADPEKDIHVEAIEDISTITTSNTKLLGNLISLTDLVVTGGKDQTQSSNDAFTVYLQGTAADGKKVTINMRIDGNITLRHPETNEKIKTWEFFKGKEFKKLVAICSYFDYNADDGVYDGEIQLMLTTLSDIEYAD